MQNNGTNFWSRNNYFWKVPISHIIQYNWKNQLYYGLFSFNLNVKYIQLYNFCLWNYRCHGLACIQASSLKSISVPNVRGDFHIYTAMQSATLTKTSKWCFVWQYEYGCLPFHIEIWIILQKYLLYNDCLDSCWSIAVKKWNDIPSQIGLANYYS